MEKTYIPRYLEKIIEQWLFKEKVIILYGARQVGKTTLVKSLISRFSDTAGYYSCDLPEVRQVLESQNHLLLKDYIGDKTMVVFDEAQQVREIGKVLKLFHDSFPGIQIVATGSSSFDLANQVGEPLTGRSLTFTLYPLSFTEMKVLYNHFELMAQLPTFLTYGLYPSVALSGIEERIFFLQNLVGNYLYKDILMFENVRRSDLLVDLLRALALQVGSEVSRHELAIKLRCGVKTVERYLDLLEKSFVVFRLRPFSRNLRSEIGKKNKIFFYDLGVRNAIIERFSSLDLRDDVGGLWENFCVLERMKVNQEKEIFYNSYFWRNHAGKEVDYLEERDGLITAFEFKWGSEKYRAPGEFLREYKVPEVKVINKDNLFEFIK